MRIRSKVGRLLTGIVWEILKTLRPATSVISGVLAAVMLVKAEHYGISEAMVRVMPITFVTMAGFVFNDVFDRTKDRIGGKNRPVASGRLAVPHALIVAVLLIMSGIITESIRGHLESFVTVVVAASLVIAYSPIAYRVPWLKGFVTAALCCLPLIYGAALTGASIPAVYLVSLSLFVFGRELLLDLADLEGDVAFGMKTLPHFLGESITLVLGWSLMFFGLALALLEIHRPAAEILVVLALLSLTACFYWYWVKRRSAMAWSRVTMLLGALAIALTI